MSQVKFQETVQTKVTENAGAATESLKGAAKKAVEKQEDLTHRVGEYLTGGDTGKGYLAVCTLIYVRYSSHTNECRRHT